MLLDPYETIPNDFYFNGFQWYLRPPASYGANVSNAWDLWRGDTSTVIAVMDIGTDTGHPDLASKIWINRAEIPGNGIDDDGDGYVDDTRGWDFGNHDNDPNPGPTLDSTGFDIGFHGTFVAGLAAAAANNSQGIAGASWNCRVMPLKVNDSTGDIQFSAVAEAFLYADMKHPAVLNMSFGTADTTVRDFFQALVVDATAANVLCRGGRQQQHRYEGVAGSRATGAVGGRHGRHGSARELLELRIMRCASRRPALRSGRRSAGTTRSTWRSQTLLRPSTTAGAATRTCTAPVPRSRARWSPASRALVRSKNPSLTPAQVAAQIVATGDVVSFDQPMGTRVNAYRALPRPDRARRRRSDPRGDEPRGRLAESVRLGHDHCVRADHLGAGEARDLRHRRSQRASIGGRHAARRTSRDPLGRSRR